MILERSVVGKSAKSVFFEDINDLDIYVEDTSYGYEKIYSVLFSRVFDGKYRVSKVFPLGGRGAVIEQYNEQISRLSRPSIFVVDGDLFILSGDSIFNKKGLYKIPFYCVENILCDEDAIISILFEEDPINSIENLSDEFDYENWVNLNKLYLYNLFVEYAISFLVNPAEQTVAFSVKGLVSSNDGCIDENKLNRRIQYLCGESVNKAGVVRYESVRRMILRSFDHSDFDELDVVSGKDYILPLLKTRFKSIVKTHMPDINLKLRLAMKCDISKIINSKLFVAG